MAAPAPALEAPGARHLGAPRSLHVLDFAAARALEARPRTLLVRHRLRLSCLV
jgi:hypothetical protein